MRDSFVRILPMAWPVLIGQLAVLGFSTVDTILIARFAANDLAALSVGTAAYVSVFVGLMGVVLAISPIAGQLFGAAKLHEAGDQVHQAIWLALGISVLGAAVLLFPGPFLDLANPTPDVAQKIRGYLSALSLSLPASLLFTVYRGFNSVVSRPKAVMSIQVSGLLLKIPLSLLFIYGWSLPVPWAEQPWMVSPKGVVGCAWATAIVMWSQVAIAWLVLHRDPFYARFALHRRRFNRPRRQSILRLLRLGGPMGASILIEVTGFTSMAFLISRQSAQAVAGHQLAANLVSLMFMVPLALATGTGTLVAQCVGARDFEQARRLGWHGVQIGVAIAVVLGAFVYFCRQAVLGVYTDNPAIIAAAMPLLVWVWWFHIGDAAQTLANFVLRSHHITFLPLVCFAVSLWGIGLVGGYQVAHSTWAPMELRGAAGYWAMSAVGLVVVGLLLCTLLTWVHRQETHGN